MKNRYYYLIALLIFLIISFYTGKIYQQNQIFRSNTSPVKLNTVIWKNYTVQSRGFSVKYPSTWVVIPYTDTSPIILKKVGSALTLIEFQFANSVPHYSFAPATFHENIPVGNSIVAFDDFFSGLGQPESAHAMVNFGSFTCEVIIVVDGNEGPTDMAIIKQILNSVKPT